MSRKKEKSVGNDYVARWTLMVKLFQNFSQRKYVRNMNHIRMIHRMYADWNDIQSRFFSAHSPSFSHSFSSHDVHLSDICAIRGNSHWHCMWRLNNVSGRYMWIGELGGCTKHGKTLSLNLLFARQLAIDLRNNAEKNNTNSKTRTNPYANWQLWDVEKKIQISLVDDTNRFFFHLSAGKLDICEHTSYNIKQFYQLFLIVAVVASTGDKAAK